MTEPCASCGLPASEHHYNGACYGICGEFKATTTGAHTMTDIDAKAREVVADNFPSLKGSGLAEVIAAALLAVRNETLEEAAKVAEKVEPYYGVGRQILNSVAVGGFEAAQRGIATSIRALKTTQPKTEET